MNREIDARTERKATQALLAMFRSLDDRIGKLEAGGEKSLLKKISENAGLVALFLGLVLTIASLHDVLVTKPEAERINSISQFNKAVSTAAQIRQELMQMQVQVKDPAAQLAMQSAAVPRILNEISTARAILPGLKDADVGIPQLMVLIFEAANAGDPVAIEFVKRAVAKTDAPVFLRSEAKRSQAKYLYATGNPNEARKAMAEAIDLIPRTAYSSAARAWDLVEWISIEFTLGDCQIAETTFNDFAEIVRNPGISMDQRNQLIQTLGAYLHQYEGQHCPMPHGFGALATK